MAADRADVQRAGAVPLNPPVIHRGDRLPLIPIKNRQTVKYPVALLLASFWHCGWRNRRPDVIDISVNNAAPHSFAIPIDPADIDFMGHVNNASYLRWVQDAVVDHWRSLAPPEAIAQHLWVALKHEITYRRPTYLGDDVIATVVLEKVQGARAFYETIIRRGEDVLAEVRSSWCCIDAQTLRPARLAKEIIEKFFPKATSAPS